MTRFPHVVFNFAGPRIQLSAELQLCDLMLEELSERADAVPFLAQVDAKDVPDYPLVIRNPMWIDRIRKSIRKCRYDTHGQVKEDVDLIWANCFEFNGLDHPLSASARGLRQLFDSWYALAFGEGWKDIVPIMEESDAAAELIRRVADAVGAFPAPLQPVEPQVAKVHPPQTGGVLVPVETALLNIALTGAERHRLAMEINVLPPELLGGVIEILSKLVDLSQDEIPEIPLSSLGTATQRTLQAFVKAARERERSVRKAHAHETLPAGECAEVLQRELDRVKALLREKRPQAQGSPSQTEVDMDELEGPSASGFASEVSD